jgi:hypothetical protein
MITPIAATTNTRIKIWVFFIFKQELGVRIQGLGVGLEERDKVFEHKEYVLLKGVFALAISPKTFLCHFF